MAMSEVIAAIEAEIAKLEQMKALATGIEPVRTPKGPAKKSTKPTAKSAGTGRGRPKGSKNGKSVATPAAPAPAVKGRRKLSPEGRTAIAEAMKRRWAERRKQSAK